MSFSACVTECVSCKLAGVHYLVEYFLLTFFVGQGHVDTLPTQLFAKVSFLLNQFLPKSVVGRVWMQSGQDWHCS